MIFTLPELPYKLEDLEPILSSETLSYHYGKHHQAYINNLNSLVVGSEFENDTLEAIIKSSEGAIFNNAAQIYNHNFYWKCLSPIDKQTRSPKPQVSEAINQSFGSFDSFKDSFTEKATKHFGSGWVWLVKTAENKLEILETHDADNPIKHDQVPLLVIDVWEHAYYIDYRNNRAEYVNNFWKLVDWEFVETQI